MTLVACQHPNVCGVRSHVSGSYAALECESVRPGPRTPTGGLRGPALTAAEPFDSADAVWTPARRSDSGLPEVSFPKLWHVGTMEPSDKQEWSYEGAGLSVSLHPEEWSEIAELGGDTWELVKPGNRFLDYHSLSADVRGQIRDYGLDSGWTAQETRWRIRWFDPEAETDRYMYVESEQAADDEVEVGFLELEDGSPAERDEVTVTVATDSFPDPTVRPGEVNPDQVLATIWIAVWHPDIDGIWFEDEYDPDNLSCPRGVIPASAVERWVRRRE